MVMKTFRRKCVKNVPNAFIHTIIPYFPVSYDCFFFESIYFFFVSITKLNPKCIYDRHILHFVMKYMMKDNMTL